MNGKIFFLIPVLALAFAGATGWAGPYNEAGIAANDSRFVGWGTTVVNYTLGPVDITNPGGATASFGTPDNTLGAADATADDPYSVLSLGDGGSITIGFDTAITNGDGVDFVVFENALAVDGVSGAFFLELAFVEVSSNGTDFFRFPSVSLTQTSTQVGTFGYLDPTNIDNLAGNQPAGYGTGFDLQDLAGISPLLDINAITQVRIVDVVGSIDPLYATYDSEGNIINDPWKTNFSTGGFDLDAIGVINQIPEPGQVILLSAGLALVLVLARRKREKQPD